MHLAKQGRCRHLGLSLLPTFLIKQQKYLSFLWSPKCIANYCWSRNPQNDVYLSTVVQKDTRRYDQLKPYWSLWLILMYFWTKLRKSRCQELTTQQSVGKHYLDCFMRNATDTKNMELAEDVFIRGALTESPPPPAITRHKDVPMPCPDHSVWVRAGIEAIGEASSWWVSALQ